MSGTPSFEWFGQKAEKIIEQRNLIAAWHDGNYLSEELLDQIGHIFDAECDLLADAMDDHDGLFCFWLWDMNCGEDVRAVEGYGMSTLEAVYAEIVARNERSKEAEPKKRCCGECKE